MFTLIKEYRRLRAQGYTSTEAFRAARIAEQWSDLEDRGLVRMRAEEETEPYEASEGTPKEVAEELRLVELYGNWCVVAEFRTSDEDRWEHGASIGMMAGCKDPLDTEHTPDLRRECMGELDRAFAELASSLATRATFAGAT